MKISYLVTCSTETDTLYKLLDKLFLSYIDCDEIVILIDKLAGSGETLNILEKFKERGLYNDLEMVTKTDLINNSRLKESMYVLSDDMTHKKRTLSHNLNNNYGAHKNYGIEHCNGDFIFQIDGDELPPESLLGENLHALLDSNPTIESYAIPRINDFRGVNDTHAQKWGWKLTESPSLKRPIVNFPDYQFRIFRKDYPRISFTRKLHEKIEGYKNYVVLPADEDYALYHDKSIEKQMETNVMYNRIFTEAENKGHSVFR